MLQQVKEMEHRGFQFEGAEASVELMLRRTDPDYEPPFELIDFTVVVEHRQGRGLFAEATVKVRVNGEVIHTAAEGNGPVNALDNALRKALLPKYPSLQNIQLTDYKVRILDSESATGGHDPGASSPPATATGPGAPWAARPTSSRRAGRRWWTAWSTRSSLNGAPRTWRSPAVAQSTQMRPSGRRP